MAEWLKATESFTCGLPGGAQASFFAGRNYKSNTPGVEGREHLFVPLDEDDPTRVVAVAATTQTATADPGAPTRRAVPGSRATTK